MSEAEERRERREWRWGVLILNAYGNRVEVTEYAAIYKNSPRLVASGLTYGEAVAMGTLMNAGGSDVGV